MSKTGIKLIDRGTPGPDDARLLRMLGLPTFDVPTHEEHFVGTVPTENESTIRIWVTPMPSNFWRFEVFCAEGNRTTTFETGSGSLSHYLPTAMQIAKGMIVVTSLQPKEEQPAS